MRLWPSCLPNRPLELEKLPQLSHGVIRVLNGVTDRPRVTVDLVVVTTRECLVTEEVDRLIIDTRNIFLGFDVL